MKNRKNRNIQVPMTVLGVGLSGVPLLPLCALVASLLGGASLDEAEAASAVGFFLSIGWLSICSVIAFVGLVDIYFGDKNENS